MRRFDMDFTSLFAASAGLFFAALAVSEFSRGLLQPTVRFGRKSRRVATLEFQPSLRDGICLHTFPWAEAAHG